MAEKKQTTKASAAEKTKAKRKAKGIAKWWRETTGELRKVVWPTPKEALQLTKVVLIVMAAMSVILGFFDFVFARLIALILA